MPSIELQNISNHICRNTSLSIQDGEFLVLAGATGAGKTTLLNVIAGLSPYEGSVRFDTISVDRLPPARRNVGYLFQSFALFPHLTVRDNVAFGLKVRGASRKHIAERVDILLRLIHIHHLENRYPKSLSGGEKQRVALARTLAPHPKILLLDEPFNSLDPRTARFLRLELLSLQKKLGLTAVYVTHNQREAFEMGDRIAVVSQGGIEQVGNPTDILFSPRTPAVSDLFGSPNIFSCDKIEGLDFGLGKATCGKLSLIVPYEGKPATKIAVLPSGVQISKNSLDCSTPNRFKGKILKIQRKSPITHIDIQIDETIIRAEMPEHSWDEIDLDASDSVYTIIPLKWIRVLTI